MQVHLYALVDGLLFADAAGGSSPRGSQAAVALFDGTPDAALAEAGPWLFDWERASGSVRHSLSVRWTRLNLTVVGFSCWRALARRA
ncbi:DUF4123 domain-containing protein [Burkholderia multivorans]|nr:DUF4123 domain-containing protein [Burkholderia multivorans]MDN7965852.1 DUF4123 domain-containing protein [Burkholderia multivorans]